MQSEETNYRLWRVRKTIFEMLTDRGYAVADKYINETKEQFEEFWREILSRGGNRNELVILVQRKSDPNDQLIVFFPDENKPVGVKPIRLYVSDISALVSHLGLLRRWKKRILIMLFWLFRTS